MLPPREGFTPSGAGAVALLVRDLATPDDLVLGRALDEPPFPGRRFQPIRPARFGLSGLGRHARGAARIIAAMPAGAIEVHNRPAVALALHRRFPDRPVRLFLHNDPLGMRATGTPRARRRLAAGIAVAVVSAHLADRWAQGGVDRPAILPNHLDIAAMPPARAPEARTKLILFAGRLVADKGADLFVSACAEALPRLRGWHARMIGADRFAARSPETAFTASLRPRAAATGVALAGYQPRDAVLRAMAEAAIVVVPSRWDEPFGLVALEAMASGAALVSTATGGLAELTRGAALQVPPDAGAIAEAVTTLVRDPSLRARLAALGRARAERYDLPEARLRLAAFRCRSAP